MKPGRILRCIENGKLEDLTKEVKKIGGVVVKKIILACLVVLLLQSTYNFGIIASCTEILSLDSNHLSYKDELILFGSDDNGNLTFAVSAGKDKLYIYKNYLDCINYESIGLNGIIKSYKTYDKYLSDRGLVFLVSVLIESGGKNYINFIVFDKNGVILGNHKNETKGENVRSILFFQNKEKLCTVVQSKDMKTLYYYNEKAELFKEILFEKNVRYINQHSLEYVFDGNKLKTINQEHDDIVEFENEMNINNILLESGALSFGYQLFFYDGDSLVLINQIDPYVSDKYTINNLTKLAVLYYVFPASDGMYWIKDNQKKSYLEKVDAEIYDIPLYHHRYEEDDRLGMCVFAKQEDAFLKTVMYKMEINSDIFGDRLMSVYPNFQTIKFPNVPGKLRFSFPGENFRTAEYHIGNNMYCYTDKGLFLISFKRRKGK